MKTIRRSRMNKGLAAVVITGGVILALIINPTMAVAQNQQQCDVWKKEIELMKLELERFCYEIS